MAHRQRADLLRAALVGRGGRGRAYPEALRRRAVKYFLDRRAEGVPAADIGPEIGIGRDTLIRWEREMRGQDAPSTGFELVRVVEPAPPAPSHNLVVHGPAGLRVEGLDLEGVVELLRRLS